RAARAQRRLVLALLRPTPHRTRPARDPAALGRDRGHRDPLLAPPRPGRRAAPALPPLDLVRDLPELRDLAAERSVRRAAAAIRRGRRGTPSRPMTLVTPKS